MCHDVGEMSVFWYLNCDLSLFSFLHLCCISSDATVHYGSTVEVLEGSSILLLCCSVGCFGGDFDIFNFVWCVMHLVNAFSSKDYLLFAVLIGVYC